MAFAPSARPNATAVFLSRRAIADAATSFAFCASSGPIPSAATSNTPVLLFGRSETLIATLTGPALTELVRQEAQKTPELEALTVPGMLGGPVQQVA